MLSCSSNGSYSDMWNSPCCLCAARAVRHGAVGATARGVQAPQEAGRGTLRRGVGGPVDNGEQEGGHKDAETRYTPNTERFMFRFVVLQTVVRAQKRKNSTHNPNEAVQAANESFSE